MGLPQNENITKEELVKKTYITVSDFLQSDNPENYDFKNQIYLDYNKCRNGKNRTKEYIQNYIKEIVEATGTNKYSLMKSYSGGFDCDNSNGSCALTGEIYSKLWGWEEKTTVNFRYLHKRDQVNQNLNIEYGGDTMNSVQTSLNKLKKEFSGTGREIENNCILSEIDSSFNDFICIYHTIGNFTLVPAGFNSRRGGEDYWDSALEILKNGWKDKFKSDIKNKDNFNSFINYFFLWDYVTVKDCEYLVNNLFVESMNSNSIDETIERTTELDKNNREGTTIHIFAKNATYCIKRRSLFMILMLKLEERMGLNNYSELRHQIFSKKVKCYESYSEVIESIKTYLKKNLDESKQKEFDTLINETILMIAKI